MNKGDSNKLNNYLDKSKSYTELLDKQSHGKFSNRDATVSN